MKIKHTGAALALAATLAFTLAACSTPAPEETGTTDGPVATQEEMDALGIGNPTSDLCDGREKITVGYDVFSDTQDYVVSMNQNLNDVAEEMGGCIEFITLVDNLDPATAVANVKTFIQREVDAVLLFQVVASAQPGIMDLLNAAGIPVISHAVPAEGSTFISQSDLEAGAVSAAALIAGAEEKFPGQTPWIVLGNEPQGGDVAMNRVNSQADVIREAFPDITDDQVILLDTNGKPDDAFTRTSSILAKLPDDSPILITGNNDDVVGAIFRALDQGGKSKNVLAAGIGALFPSGIENVCSYDQFVGTVDFAPDTLGKYINPALLAVVDGVKLPEMIEVPVSLLTKDGVPARFPDFDC
ncbi:hypothetical protein BH10ACT7_BH10ACT7_14510 [soil metagenome]